MLRLLRFQGLKLKAQYILSQFNARTVLPTIDVANSGRSFAVLSHFRWCAAFLVAFSHIRQSLYVDYPQLRDHGLLAKIVYWLAGYGHAGVVVFFVLSGFLVGGKALHLLAANDVADRWPEFLIDRFSRIFIVLWPALILTLLVFFLLSVMIPDAPFMTRPGWGWDLQTPLCVDRSYVHWLAAVTLLNEFVAPTLRANAPLWSLACEWFYYMMTLAAVLLYRRVRSPGALVVIGYSLALLSLSLFRNPGICLGGLVWLLGLAARMTFDHNLMHGGRLKVSALGVLLFCLVLDRVMWVPDLILGLAVAFVISNRDWSRWYAGATFGDKLASFSYSLYVTHFPATLFIMGWLCKSSQLGTRLQFNVRTGATGLGIFLLAVLFALVFSKFTEYRTNDLRRLIGKLRGESASSSPRMA